MVTITNLKIKRFLGVRNRIQTYISWFRIDPKDYISMNHCRPLATVHIGLLKFKERHSTLPHFKPSGGSGRQLWHSSPANKNAASLMLYAHLTPALQKCGTCTLHKQQNLWTYNLCVINRFNDGIILENGVGTIWASVNCKEKNNNYYETINNNIQTFV
jgi:hypothetical protein